MRKEIAEKKAKEAKKKQEKPIVKEKQSAPPIENITLSIEDEFNELNNIEDKNKDKYDLNIKPIFDSEDMCCECGHNTNAWKEYPIEKLELWEEVLCHCDSDSSSEDNDDEKII